MQEIRVGVPKIPQPYLDLVNQVFELEKKAGNLQEDNSIQRNINKIKALLEEEFFKQGSTLGLSYHNPLGEGYSETRTDCEAMISGTGVDNLEIIEVIKPIIFYAYQENGHVHKAIAQRAVVVAQSKN